MAECNYSGEERRTSYPHTDEAAKKAVKDVFAILGVDIDSPAQVEEFRKSLRWGDSMRKITEQGKLVAWGAIVLTILGIFATGILAKLGLTE